MNQINDCNSGATVLPGVDLALWLRIVATVLLLLIAGGIALAID
jgi:hypothetical protein